MRERAAREIFLLFLFEILICLVATREPLLNSVQSVSKNEWEYFKSRVGEHYPRTYFALFLEHVDYFGHCVGKVSNITCVAWMKKFVLISEDLEIQNERENLNRQHSKFVSSLTRIELSRISKRSLKNMGSNY